MATGIGGARMNKAGDQVTTAPPRKVEITPADADLDYSCSLWVGTGGTVVATCANTGNVCNFVNVPDGSYLLGPFSRIAAATTASDIIAYY